MHHVSLPSGRNREHVHYRGHDYTLRGSETRTLTTGGAFRAVPASDLRDALDRPLVPRHGELWHLRDSGLVHTVRLDRDNTVVTLTKEGRDLLESADSTRTRPIGKHFIAAFKSLGNSSTMPTCIALTRTKRSGCATMAPTSTAAFLENDLKREYQEFLQDHNRDRDDSDGRPDRTLDEIRDWAREHDLPCDDRGHVQFPDVRIEYDIDGREHTLDVEVMTPHYRGAHAASKSSSGWVPLRGDLVEGREGGTEERRPMGEPTLQSSKRDEHTRVLVREVRALRHHRTLRPSGLQPKLRRVSPDEIGEWIRRNTTRVNLLIRSEMGTAGLSRLESIAHRLLQPFEGRWRSGEPTIEALGRPLNGMED